MDIGYNNDTSKVEIDIDLLECADHILSEYENVIMPQVFKLHATKKIDDPLFDMMGGLFDCLREMVVTKQCERNRENRMKEQ